MAERLWRARKTHIWIDARLRAADDERSFELQFFYDGALVFSRTCATRDAAASYAAHQLRELQRAGWSDHW